MKSNSLALRALIVAREEVPLTAPIDLELAGGEMLVIHGSNGAGKSTLLKTIAGLLPAPEGAITLNGELPSDAPILYLGHKRGLSLEMTVYDNVALWAKLNGVPELIPAALHYFELTDIAIVTLDRLSAGWQQRVALTRLITQPALFWLLDEPFANLDGEGMQLLQSLIQSRREQGGIILIATHGMIQGEGIKMININILNHLSEVKVA